MHHQYILSGRYFSAYKNEKLLYVLIKNIPPMLKVLKIKLRRAICFLYPVPGRRLLQCSYSHCGRLDRFVLSFFNALFFPWCTWRIVCYLPKYYVFSLWFSLKAIFFYLSSIKCEKRFHKEIAWELCVVKWGPACWNYWKHCNIVFVDRIHYIERNF